MKGGPMDMLGSEVRDVDVKKNSRDYAGLRNNLPPGVAEEVFGDDGLSHPKVLAKVNRRRHIGVEEAPHYRELRSKKKGENKPIYQETSLPPGYRQAPA